jgi:hypothetical protein
MSDIIKTKAWNDLRMAAVDFAADSLNKATAQALSDAAKEWARVCSAPSIPQPGAVFPNYGRNKGLPVAGASEETLLFYRSGCSRTLADPEKSRWHEKERVLLAAIDAELGKGEQF